MVEADTELQHATAERFAAEKAVTDHLSGEYKEAETELRRVRPKGDRIAMTKEWIRSATSGMNEPLRTATVARRSLPPRRADWYSPRRGTYSLIQSRVMANEANLIQLLDEVATDGRITAAARHATKDHGRVTLGWRCEMQRPFADLVDIAKRIGDVRELQRVRGITIDGD